MASSTLDKFLIKGIFIDTVTMDSLRIRNGYLLIENGIIQQFFEKNPDVNIKLYDYSDKLIIPGLIDLHLHAPQYSYCGTGMDLELLDWLNKYTFKEESKYNDIEYSRKNYEIFVNNLEKSATTRAVIFASIYVDSTLLLMDLIESKKIFAYVGKVGMDRNSPDYYIEKNGKEETIRFIEECLKKNYKYVKPIITPRFTPSVSDAYMEQLGIIAKKYNLAVQSHLSENQEEIKLVKELRKNDSFYAQSYDKYGLFGNERKTVMAHCIYSNNEENDLIKKNGVYIAHCPTSNVNIITGICPASMYLRNGYNICLGTDTAGGHTLDLLTVMRYAIQMSKMRYLLVDKKFKPLTLSEVLYIATYKGGSFFGKVGLFEKDYEFDALVLDESLLKNLKDFNISERLERFIYSSDARIEGKFIRGNKII
jgi:guanine deaminase